MTTYTIRVITAAGTNASEVGESYTGFGCSWRNSVDRCDSDGSGRVFIDCGSAELRDAISDELVDDDRVVGFSDIG